ncbi:MAG: ATPase, partial [Steroidobacteraceae bacterium]
ALGPLQEMAVAGVITVEMDEKDGATVMVVTHRVSGDASHKLDQLAPIVDQVNGVQFGNLAEAAAGGPR